MQESEDDHDKHMVLLISHILAKSVGNDRMLAFTDQERQQPTVKFVKRKMLLISSRTHHTLIKQWVLEFSRKDYYTKNKKKMEQS